MATKTKKKKQPKDIAKSFSIDLAPWNGIITSQDAYTIPEDTATWISGLPKLTGAIENVPDANVVYTHTANIVNFFTFVLGSNQYFCILDGSYLRMYSSSFTEIANFATTVTKVDYAIQDNQYIWITAKNNFLITFNGTTIYNLTSNGVTGDAICYWKGRIFIGKNRIITFSVPNPDATGNINPFNTANGAGAITLTVSVFSQILALIPKEDSIYIFTDKSIVSLIGTTISNDPMNWYITEIVKDVGITGIRNYVVNEHTVYFHSPFGIYEITATAPQKIDDAITNVTDTISGICFFSYNQIPYIAVSCKSYINNNVNAIYCYNFLTNKWYALNIDAKVMSNNLGDAWFINGTKIYKMFASNDYLPLHVKSKIFFNLENIYYNIKNIILYGRGNFNYLQEFIVLVFAGQQNNIIFQTSGNDLIQIAQQQDFWLAVLKPSATLPYAMRVKQFQIELVQSNKSYSEIISVRIKGSQGARYV
jgi:hypothetical protein